MKAVIVGLDPALLDVAPGPYDDVTSKRVRAAMDDAVASLEASGIEGSLFLLAGPTETTLIDLEAALRQRQPDAVMIGAGVRLDPELSWFFERMVNLVVAVTPKAKLCFNETPEAMATAVRRVLPSAARNAGHQPNETP